MPPDPALAPALADLAEPAFEAVFWFGFCLGVLAMVGLLLVALGVGLPKDRSLAGTAPETRRRSLP